MSLIHLQNKVCSENRAVVIKFFSHKIVNGKKIIMKLYLLKTPLIFYICCWIHEFKIEIYRDFQLRKLFCGGLQESYSLAGI